MALAVCFGSLPPALAQNTKDIVDRLEAALGVTLPSPYRAKFKEFVATNKIMCDEGSNAFTEQFIKDQMKANLGINRQNQFLFVWNAIYHEIKKDYIYDGSDGNFTILDDYDKVSDAMDACEAKYRKDYISYIKKRSAEADRRSAEADRRSAEAKQRSAEAKQRSEEALLEGLDALKWFYDYYKELPNSVKPDDIKEFKNTAKWIIPRCKEYNIDYKSKLSPEVRKFYGIE